MRSTPIALALMLGIFAAAAAYADASTTAEYAGQDDPLPEQSTTLSGRTLNNDTEVLTPKGIMNEETFNALMGGGLGVPAARNGESPWGYGFDEEGSTLERIEPAAGDSQTPYATTTGKAPSDEITPANQTYTAPAQPAAMAGSATDAVQKALGTTAPAEPASIGPGSALDDTVSPAAGPAAQSLSPEVTGVTVPESSRPQPQPATVPEPETPAVY